MFPDSGIANQFYIGKTKSRYMILYGLAPHFKSRLREAIHSLIYDQSFDESLISVEQLMSDFGMNEEILSKLDY